VSNADEFAAWLKKKQAAVVAATGRSYYRVGALVKDTAVKYAPKSPTQAEKRKRSTATAAQWKAARKRRSARSTSRTTPGGLMRSIEFKATPEFAEVYVAANSEAGKYAFAIHELKGTAWKKRGPGTEAKGAKADDKFITRAVQDNQANIAKIIQSGVRAELQKD
jgi:hypothetical protein